MKRNLTGATLFFCTLLSGFYAGIGFFVAMGGNPAIKLMSDPAFVEYWQHTDFYMAERMRIFGPLLMAFVFTSTIILFKKNRSSFYFMLAAFVILLADVVFTFSTNMPLNQLIQSWDLKNLPSNANEVRWKIVDAFDKRLFFMIGCFVMVLLAVWTQKPKPNTALINK